MGTVRGRVGGGIGGYDVEADVTSQTISGRIGGACFGMDINLTYNLAVGSIEGRIGGLFWGQDVSGQISDAHLSVRVGGAFAGNDISLSVTDNTVSGRCGGEFAGFDIDLEFDNGVRAVGRLGGPVIGMSVDGLVEDVPLTIAAFLFAVTYYIYKLNHRSKGSGSHSHHR